MPCTSPTPYHYTECGLDNIYLTDGFTREDYDGEEYVSVENVDGLWKAICFSLVMARRPLVPSELRFLRDHLDFTQAELARLLRVDAQTVARWEKGKTEIPGPAEIALRRLALGAPGMQPEGNAVLAKVHAFVATVASAGADDHAPAVFARQDGGWQPARAA